jgi:hypothetical protein
MAVQSHEQRENTCQRARHTEERRTELSVLSDHELVTRGQSELVERQAAGDRLACFTGGTEFLIPSSDGRAPDIRGSSRPARSHYCIGERKVRSEREISGTRDRPENADAHEWRNLDLLRLDVLQDFGCNTFLQLRAKYTRNRNHDHPRKLQRAVRTNDDCIPVHSIRNDRYHHSVTNLEIAIVEALANGGSRHRILCSLSWIACRRAGFRSCRRGNKICAGDQKS